MTEPKAPEATPQYNFTKENARIVGAKGGKRSAELRAMNAENKKGMSPERLAKEVFLKKSEQLARLLVSMALGSDGFEELDKKDRMTATLKALEFGIGRPSAAKPEEPAKPEQAQVSIA